MCRRSFGQVQLRAGTLYTALDRLRADELVEMDREEIVDEQAAPVLPRLTPKGADVLAAGRGNPTAGQRGRRAVAAEDPRRGSGRGQTWPEGRHDRVGWPGARVPAAAGRPSSVVPARAGRGDPRRADGGRPWPAPASHRCWARGGSGLPWSQLPSPGSGSSRRASSGAESPSPMWVLGAAAFPLEAVALIAVPGPAAGSAGYWAGTHRPCGPHCAGARASCCCWPPSPSRS